MAFIGTSKSAANLDVGAGEFSFCNFDTAVNPNQAFFTLGNCSEATLAWEVNTIEKRDATRGTREKIAEVETQRDATLTITMDESDPLKYALAMYGSTAIKTIEAKTIAKAYTVSPGQEIFITIDDTQTPAYNYSNLTIKYLTSIAASIGAVKVDTQAGTAISAAFTDGSVKVGGAYTGTTDDTYYIKITASNAVPQTISDVTFQWKKGLTGTYSSDITADGTFQTIDSGVTLQLGASLTGQDYNAGDIFKFEVKAAATDLKPTIDYIYDEVDVANGKVRFPITSTIENNTKIVVSCNVEAQTIARIYAGMKKKIEGMLRFEYDPSHGRRKSFIFYHVSIKPNGDDSLIGEDWASRQITASVLASNEHADPENPDSKYYRIDYPAGNDGILVS